MIYKAPTVCVVRGDPQRTGTQGHSLKGAHLRETESGAEPCTRATRRRAPDGQPLRGLPGGGGGRLGPQGWTGSEAGSKGPNPGCTCRMAPDLREPQCPRLSNRNHVSTHILKSVACRCRWGWRRVIEKKEVQEHSLGGTSKNIKRRRTPETQQCRSSVPTQEN